MFGGFGKNKDEEEKSSFMQQEEERILPTDMGANGDAAAAQQPINPSEGIDLSPNNIPPAEPAPELPAGDIPEFSSSLSTEPAPQAQAPIQPEVPAPEAEPTQQSSETAAEQPQPVQVDPDAKPMRLGDRLIELGMLSEDQLNVALKEQKNNRKLLGQILVDMGFISESALGEVLAESAGTETFDPTTAVLDAEIINKVPKDVAVRNKVVPIAHEGNTVTLAMADVHNVIAVDQVKRYFPRQARMKPIYCSDSQIHDLIEKYYDYETTIDGIIKEIETGVKENNAILDGKQEGYVNPTVRLVNAFLVDAIRQGASDIHFEPEGTFLRIRYRIDGQLIQIRSIHKDYWSAIAVRIKIMSGMNIAETRLPQDGRINYNVAGRDVDFRVATQPTIHGENIVMRLLDKKKALMPLSDLGFTGKNEVLLKKILKKPEGIIIVTGPTGSGKTTTLYSVLEYINSIDVNIMTLEDPVEYQLSLIRQTNIREGSGVGFAEGMKALMRQDPDVIFIGEVRDETTANMSIRAAMTGHKVFSTLHTNDALGIIPRLFDIGVTPELLAGSLVCGIAQRLARRLCPHCKEEVEATEEECKILGVDPAKPPKIHKAVGCDKCDGKGYKGRIALHEIMPVDKGMDELISTHATRNKMEEYLLENGFVPMVDDATHKVLAGLIDVPEMMRSVDVTDRL